MTVPLNISKETKTLMKVFSGTLIHKVVEEANNFSINNNVVATQSHLVNGMIYFVVYYKTNNY